MDKLLSSFSRLFFSFLFPASFYSGAWTWPFFPNSAGRRMAIHYELEERNFCLSWTQKERRRWKPKSHSHKDADIIKM
jgi:hypothetical protein